MSEMLMYSRAPICCILFHLTFYGIQHVPVVHGFGLAMPVAGTRAPNAMLASLLFILLRNLQIIFMHYLLSTLSARVCARAVRYAVVRVRCYLTI